MHMMSYPLLTGKKWRRRSKAGIKFKCREFQWYVDPDRWSGKGPTDGYDELSSLSWKKSGDQIQRRDQAECIGVCDSESRLTIDHELRRILNSVGNRRRLGGYKVTSLA